MGNSQFQKIRLLKLYDILKHHSDEEHQLSVSELLNHLDAEGIAATRKTIYSDVDELNEYGYEIMTTAGKRNTYYVADREFDVPEIKVLMDAIMSANFLTSTRTDEILKKLSRLNGDYMAKDLMRNCVSFGSKKALEGKTYYHIVTINDAISKKKQLSFQYTTYNSHGKKELRKDGKRYVTNPLTLVFDDGKYYLVTYSDKYVGLTIYRVDRMCNVAMEKINISAKAQATEQFNKMKKQMFSMHHGEEISCTMEIEENMIDIVIDRFGDNVKFYQNGDKLQFTAKVQNSEAFISWCMTFASGIKVLAPDLVIEKIKERISTLSGVYTN